MKSISIYQRGLAESRHLGIGNQIKPTSNKPSGLGVFISGARYRDFQRFLRRIFKFFTNCDSRISYELLKLAR